MGAGASIAEAGSLAGRYRLGEVLGRGRWGVVRAAIDGRLGRTVAVKTLHPGVADALSLARFEREARAAAGLGHPNIVQVLDVGTEDGAPFVVMEHLAGETLADRIAREGALPVAEALRIAAELFEALAAAHAAGIVHRDVRPSNVVLARLSTGASIVKLVDFGLAHLGPGHGPLTAEGAFVGSPAYAAPDVLEGAPPSPHGDLYSACATLYEALAGHPAFEGASPIVIRARVLASVAPPIAQLRPDVPAELSAALERALAKDAAARREGTAEVIALAQAARPSARPLRSAPAMTKTEAGGLVGDAGRPIGIGSVLGGRYRLVRPIGTGGMGVVYEARDEELGRPVAVKVVRPGGGAGPTHYARLEREARAVASLGHPNIVGVTDLGVTERDAYVVMELLSGESLAARIARKGRLPEREVIDLALQLLDGLAAAHAAGMVHRDVKPANVFVVPLASGAHLAKLLDFGIVKLREEEQHTKLTHAGLLLGTPSYMPPEQVRGDAVDARADVYAIGATMYEALTGAPPYQAESPLATAGQVLTTEARDVSLARPDVSAALVAIVRRAMAREAGDRYASAREMRDALAALKPEGVGTLLSIGRGGAPAQVEGSRAAPTAPTVGEARARSRTGAIVGALVATLVLTIAAALAIGLGGGDGSESAAPTVAPSVAPPVAPPVVAPPRAEDEARRRAEAIPSGIDVPPDPVVAEPVAPEPVVPEPLVAEPVARPPVGAARTPRTERRGAAAPRPEPPEEGAAPGIMNPFD